MRTFKVTITRLPQQEATKEAKEWMDYAGSPGVPWHILIEDYDTDEVLHETTVTLFGSPDNGEHAERFARDWINEHRGSKPRSFFVEVEDVVPPDYTGYTPPPDHPHPYGSGECAECDPDL